MTGLQGTTTVPGLGTVKKGYVAAGVALTAGIVGYAWYRRANGGDTAGGDTSYYADTRTGSELPTSAYTNPAPNADGQSGTGIGGDSTWHAPSTDPEWAQAAIEALSWYEPGYVSGIVGRYLARQPLTSTEANVIREAWAQIGHPPGNQLIITATTGTGTGAGAGTGTTTTPTPAAGGGKPRGYGWVRVSAGATPAAIAAHYGITVTQFYAWNGPGRIRAGDWVKIRGGANPATGYKG